MPINETPKTIEDALKVYADAGIAPEPLHIQEAYEVQQQRQKQLEQDAAESTVAKHWSTRYVEAFNKWYPKFLQTLLGLGDTLITLTQTVLIAFGVPALLIGFIIVEQGRVLHGSLLWESDYHLAGLGSWVLVLGNLIFELVANWKEHQAGYTAPSKFEFSFRIWMMRLRYWFGGSIDNKAWSPQPKSPANRARSVLRFITLAILFLAVSGSMRDVISETKGTWLEAIEAVFTKSTLLQFVTWSSGLLFALAVVFAAQALTEYISEKVVEIVSLMLSKRDDKAERIAEAAGMAAAYHLYARFVENKRMLRTQRSMATSSAAEMPSVGYHSVTLARVGQNGKTANINRPSDGAGLSASQNVETKTKVDFAVDLIMSDKTLKRLTTRELEELYPDISRSTWATAIKRAK
jgi:hypothetical protein